MLLRTVKTRRLRLTRLYASLAVIAGYWFSTVAAPIGLTPLAVTAGSPAGSVNLSEMEHINLYNGQLAFALPLLTIEGRGEVSHTITVPIQRRLYIQNVALDQCTAGFCAEGCSAESCGFVYAKFLEQVLSQDAFPAPVRLWGRREGVSIRNSTGSSVIYLASLSRFTLTMADGTEYELRDKNSDGKPFEWQGLTAPLGNPRGTEFVTADGTSANFYSTDPITDLRLDGRLETPIPPYCGGSQDCQTMTTPSGVVMTADGTRYDITQGRTTRMTDRNGNRIEFQYTSQQIIGGGTTLFLTKILDPLDREVNISYAAVTGNAYDEITYSGINQASRSIKVYRQTLEATLVSGGTLPTLAQLYPELNPNDSHKDNPSVVSRVQLANGTSYFFKYNTYGELARVELPTGGVIEYDFKNGVENGPASGLYGDLSAIANSTNETYLYRRLSERRVYDGTNLIGFTTYGKSDTWNNNVFPTRTSPLPFIETKNFDVQIPTCYASQNCKLLGIERHYFVSSAAQSYSGSNQSTQFKLSRYPFWNEGRETKTEFLDTDGTTVLQKQELTWNQPNVSWWTASAALAPPNNPRVVESKLTIITNGSSHVSKQSAINPADQSIGFDLFQNQTDLWEYDFGDGAPGRLLRHTHTVFETDPTYTGAPSAGGAHLRRLPRTQFIYSVDPLTKADVAVVAASENIYDEALYTAASYPTLTGWIDPARTTRGNQTSSKSWLNFDGANLQTYPSGSFVVTHSTYDQSGNVVTSTDPLGRESTVLFTDADGTNTRGNHAFATLTTSPIPDSSGAHGSTSGFTVRSVFDHFTGLVVSSTDVRGEVTTVEYNDPFSRPTRVVRPAGGGETVFEYQDNPQNTQNPGTVYSKVRKQIDQNIWEETFTYYDGLGRKVRVQTHDAIGDIFTDIVYDSAGRITKSSSPYRQNAEKLWVETVYDVLGRTREVISPKIANEAIAAKITTDYSSCPLGVVTTTTNQAGNKTRSITNALGQLIRVDEPNSANDLGPIDTPVQPTFYKYDTIGNLRRVTQGPQDPDSPNFNPQTPYQSRFFLFDSLGRLIRVRQPEQNTNSAVTLTDPVTGNADWSLAFTHRATGSIETTTDAKGAVTTFSYDNLERVHQRSYTLPQTTDVKKVTSPTATVSLKYDGVLSPAPNNPNPVIVPFSKGALTEVANGIATTQLTGFTNLGRVSASQQITDGQVYTFHYEYNFAGALTKEIYPSGRTISNGFDTAGDLSSVSTTFPNQMYVSDLRYTAGGSVDQLRLGNGKWETYKTNARQQVTEIGLGDSPTDTNTWKVNYDYGRFNQSGAIDVSKNDGNVIKQTITVPGVSTPFEQTYAYDSLNRLTDGFENSGSTQNWRQTFGYDRYGNRNSFTYNINQVPVALNNINNPSIDVWTNRITSGQGYDYDLNGNLILDPQGRKFAFDADNRQRQLKDANDQVIASYDYDGNGRRIKKTTGSQQTVFVYDTRGKLIAEYSTEPSTAIGASFVTADVLNSPRVITDRNGAPVSRRDYMPFGESISAARSSSQQYGVADGLRRSFTGYQRDNESQLDFAEARYYNPAHGRFTAVDPMLATGGSSNPQAFNRYVYAGNNPTLRADANGQAWYVYWIDKLIPGGGSARIMLYEWHSENRTLTDEVAREYVIYASYGGKDFGWKVLDPFENRFTRVSSLAEGRAQIEAYKRQAALNFIVGAVEAYSLVIEFSGVLDKSGVERGSEQYKLGQNVGTMIKWLGVATGVGFTNAVIGKFGKAGVKALEELNVFTKSNFREGLIRATGINPGKLFQAHHVFPQQFTQFFEKLGLNIHAPEFLQWWEAGSHLKNARAYNAEWAEFIKSNPTKEQVLQFGRDIMERYGLKVRY